MPVKLSLFLALFIGVHLQAQTISKPDIQGYQCLSSEKPVSCLQNMIVSVDHDLAFYQDLGKYAHLISKTEFITQLALIYLEKGNLTQAFNYFEKALENIETVEESAFVNKAKVGDIRKFIIEHAKVHCDKFSRGSQVYEDCHCEAYKKDLTPIAYATQHKNSDEKVDLEKALASSATAFSKEEHGTIQNYLLACLKRFLNDNPLDKGFVSSAGSDICDVKFILTKSGEYMKRDAKISSSYHLHEVGEPFMKLANYLEFPNSQNRLTIGMRVIIQPGEKESYSYEGGSYYVTYAKK